MAPYPPQPQPLPRQEDEALHIPTRSEIQHLIDRALEQNPPAAVTALRQRQNNNAPPATTTIVSPGTTVTNTPAATVTVISGGGTNNNGNNGNSDDGPTSAQTLSGGAIAGIVIGSIAGLLLLIWIFRSCSNLGKPSDQAPKPDGGAWYDGVRAEPYPTHPPPRSPHRHRSRSHRSHSRHSSAHHHRRSSVGEVREVTPVAVVRQSSQREYVYGDDYDRGAGRGRREHRSRSRGRYDRDY
ncbi:hypothetical protein B0H66DRAFT_592947 [Apodospora peruviana]|uniref:Uncharacterized protein n=1 Tax=Apodospora peruviana TaxID=516989 RepID=A0AAE0I1X6_9PEZI|nr:hypothetical protein B0H66DRAFT_592947 [Apodospora peruviana]